MNKKLIAIVALFAVVALGGAAYYYFFSYDEVEVARTAFAGDGRTSCTFVDPNTEKEGNIYGRDGDVRIDLKGQPINMDAPQNSEEEVQNHVLFTKGTAYIWSEDEKQGYKYPVELEDNAEGPIGNFEDKEKFRNDYEEHNYSCRRGADDSLFEKPEEVEFLDFGSMSNEADVEADATQ